MQITETLVYPAPPDVVYTMMTDEEFHDRVCVATYATSHSAEVTWTQGRATVITHRVMPTGSFPDFAKAIVGNSLELVETIRYADADADGGRVGDLRIALGSTPIGLIGAIRIVPMEGGTEVTFEGNLKCTVPFLGGKIESAAAPTVIAGVHKEYGVGMAWLAELGHE
jgi:uncharacterized protein YndB with AHSA1/START domain